VVVDLGSSCFQVEWFRKYHTSGKIAFCNKAIGLNITFSSEKDNNNFVDMTFSDLKQFYHESES